MKNFVRKSCVLFGVVALKMMISEALLIVQPCCVDLNHMPADFGPVYSEEEGVEGILVQTGMLCDDSRDAVPDLSEKIAFTPRGDCKFTEKAINAQESGARGIVVFNSEPPLDGTVFVKMKPDGPPEESGVEIPAVFVSYGSAAEIHGLLFEPSLKSLGIKAVINGTAEYNPEILDFSTLLLESVLFMFRLILVISSIFGLFHLMFCLRRRYASRKRLRMVRRLPTRSYRAPPVGEDDVAFLEDLQDNETNVAAVGPAGTYARVNGQEEDEEEEVRQSASFPVNSETQIEMRDLGMSAFEENCVVCISDFEDGELITILPCGHCFHQACIEPWLINKSALCPICKQSILPSGDARSLEEVAASEDISEAPISRPLAIFLSGAVLIVTFGSMLYLFQMDG